MAALQTTPGLRSIGGVAVAAEPSRAWRFPVLPATIAAAWLVVIAAQATGNAAALHHDALIEGGPPLWVALPTFLVAWQVMVAAMMLPASLSTVHSFQGESQALNRPRLAVAAFLGAYAIVWAGFGLLAFSSDVVLHYLVDMTPWLGARPWLIEAGVLAVAAGYQFAPLKRRSLAACRHAADPATTAPQPGRGATWLGLRHGLACLGSSWALMLVMFAAGFASLFSMVALTGLMVYEATGRHGHRAATGAGVVLLLAALTALSAPFSVGS